jgi:putative transposase
MAEQTVRQALQFKLKPTPAQERMLDRTLMLCRHVYHAARAERREAWQKCGVSMGS